MVYASLLFTGVVDFKQNPPFLKESAKLSHSSQVIEDIRNYDFIETKYVLFFPADFKIQAAIAFLGVYNYNFHSIWNLIVNLPMNLL